MTPTFFKIVLAIILVCFVIGFGYPAAFIVQHGWYAAGWPPELANPSGWAVHFWDRYINFPMIFGNYWGMAWGQSPAFVGGGITELYVILGMTIFVVTLLLLGNKLLPLRDMSGIHGRAQWATQRAINAMNQGLEIGKDPSTGRAVRVQVEGNLLTIAPPRSGKTGGLIIPNLVFPDPSAWAGPAVVIAPKGDAYLTVKRRREGMSRAVLKFARQASLFEQATRPWLAVQYLG
jgi:type IV secretion system protein VirD4